MYPQLSPDQKSIISLYLESVRILNENKDPAHTPVLTVVHEMLLDELQESLKNHSMAAKIQNNIHNSNTDYERLISPTNTTI